MDRNIIISIRTILTAFAIGGILYLFYRLGSIIGLVLIALLITITLEHAVKFFGRQTLLNKPIRRPLAVLIVYFILFLVLTIGITIGLDPVINQSQKLIQTITQNQEVFSFGRSIDFSLSDVVSSFVATSGGVISATASIFNNVTSIISILILSIYLSIDWLNIKEKFTELFPEKERQRIKSIIFDVEDNVGLWLRGELILMFVIGLFSYFWLLIIGVDFPLALGIIAGLLEIVPIIGPVISAVIAALVAVTSSPVKALLVILVFTIIQQLEGNILVPKVMQKVSGFSPIIILIALLVGSNLFGVVGAIFAVPVLMIGTIIFKNVRKYYYKPQEANKPDSVSPAKAE